MMIRALPAAFACQLLTACAPTHQTAAATAQRFMDAIEARDYGQAAGLMDSTQWQRLLGQLLPSARAIPDSQGNLYPFFAQLRTPAALDSASPRQLAALWLAAQDPEVGWRIILERMGCRYTGSGPDSLPRLGWRVAGAVPRDDSIAVAVYYPRSNPVWEAKTGTLQGPFSLLLIQRQAGWRVVASAYWIRLYGGAESGTGTKHCAPSPSDTTAPAG